MRMVVISLTILLVLMAIWTWVHFTSIDPMTEYYREELTGLGDLIDAGDWDSVESNMVNYYEEWQDTRELWIYFVNQDDIDNIDASMEKLKSFVGNRDKVMAQAELEHLKVLFVVIKENECVTLDNIF
ncbi:MULTISPECIES: DUF4363 family protein [unclassified Sedimentibacter]|uniref:DUF4363 family protein n=1 Tax=unclassified Sedimentibacter TaxID=2649220 RepID=UPI0027DEABED|nr:DUF4363 family protein [Sedimentibacter sp. MB35-C1]WMJ75708.1 DUF4363 family protein [Sedimentibacter sp. MB35-C1]